MTQKEKALALLLTAALAVVVVLFICRGKKPKPPPNSIEIGWLSLAISNYRAETGAQPKRIPEDLVEGGFLDPKWLTDGQLLDRWGTPYAIFLAEINDKDWHYPSGMAFEFGRQRVEPDRSARAGAYPPLHQIISAGPDREFGTQDDLVNWTAAD